MSRISAMFGVLGMAGIVAAAPAAAQHQHEHAGKPPERLGSAAFTTTCAPAVANDFNRAIALLHSFWFGAAAAAAALAMLIALRPLLSPEADRGSRRGVQ